MNAEELRLIEASRKKRHWKRWGPYLSERQWGTVREDYSPGGTAWEYFSHDMARSRVYRWGEDGLCGISDNHQRMCFALALWNGKDPILKERLFGLTGNEGNHGEDVKECYYYLDSTPTHSYMKCLYKYPQCEYPYAALVNHGRSAHEPELELADLGVFDEGRYWDVFVEYAKADVNDIVIRIQAVNRGPDTATLHLLPTLWFRNQWAWGRAAATPRLWQVDAARLETQDAALGRYLLSFSGDPKLLFTDNETNTERFYGFASRRGYYKDAFHEYVVHGRDHVVSPDLTGTKACGHYVLTVAGGKSETVTLRLRPFDADEVNLEETFAKRIREADEFYDSFQPKTLSADAKMVQRMAFSGMLWSKQYYHYVVEEWLDGDPGQPEPPPERRKGRNSDWRQLYNSDVISMPDKWEYPWYAAWDLAFHMIPYSLIDPPFAKQQLGLFLREWYMHPNGQLPAYEWALGDVNPPVHAWACWRVYTIDGRIQGRKDVDFLESVFHKLLMNFTWWVNRKDSAGKNIFEGGFLGLDNIGLFDRSKPIPGGGILEQSDATSWMAMYCLNMLRMALELARARPVYEDIASKFFEHFLQIASAMSDVGGGLWDEEDGFYYDRIVVAGRAPIPVKVRSVVGLIPLFAVDTLEAGMIDRLPGFHKRMEWFLNNRPELCQNMASMTRKGQKFRRLLSVVTWERLERILRVMLDEREFLSPYGIRSVSKAHEKDPFVLQLDGTPYSVEYEPAESTTGIFGGNSNWRGPVWFPVNYLMIESLQKFHYYFGEEFRVEFPTGSGQWMNLWDVSVELSRRLSRLFLRDADGRRPTFGGSELYQNDPHFRDYPLFYEYFHGDNGAGIGASHQTGWTGLVAKLLQQSGE